MNFLNILPLAKTGLNIIDQLVEDKDKKAEMAYNWNQALLDAAMKLATTQTVPWVDALIKFMLALVALGRPIGSFVLSLYGLNMMIGPGGDVDPNMVSGSLATLFPIWMAARERDKVRKHELKRRDPDEEEYMW